MTFNMYACYQSRCTANAIRNLFRGSKASIIVEDEGDWLGVHVFSNDSNDLIYFERFQAEFAPHVHNLLDE